MRKNKLMRKIKAFLIIAISLLFVFTAVCAYNLPAVSERYSDYEVRNAVVHKINGILIDKTKTYADKLKAAVRINQNSGRISSIYVETTFLNVFAAETVNDTITYLYSARRAFGIPIGNLTPARLLSGHGPKLKLTLIPLGNVSGAIRSDFYEAGINQTVHRVTLEIRGLINVAAPFSATEFEINISYVLSETVIVGEVPRVIFG